MPKEAFGISISSHSCQQLTTTFALQKTTIYTNDGPTTHKVVFASLETDIKSFEYWVPLILLNMNFNN